MDNLPPTSIGWTSMRSEAPYLAIAAGLVVVQVLALTVMGASPICKCGYVGFWYGNAAGPETSQQISDWYTPSHVIHGILFYGLLRLVAPSMPLGLRLAVATGIEVGWEILENTPLIIERYRQGGLAQGYIGDSIVNSVSDTLAAGTGFLLASRLPVLLSLALVIAAEAFTGFMIRDNLMLNIVQLITPNETISRWQAGR